MKRIIWTFVLPLVLLACSPKASEERTYCTEVTTLSKLSKAEVKQDLSISIADVKGVNCDEVVTLDEPENNSKPDKVVPQVIKKKIIKDGRLGLQVTDLPTAKKQIDSLVKVLGGYYANENLRNSDQESGYQLTIRIPVVNFEKFLYSAENGSGKVIYKEIEARDVTEEFVDIESRLNSKRNSLARYNEILKRANTVKDIIEIAESIRVLQEEIESSEGRLRYLNDCVNYSTLNLVISTEKDFTYKPQKRDNFWEKFKESVVEGWFGLVDFILGIFSMWPFWLVVTGLFFLIKRGIKKFRKKRQEKKALKNN